MSDENKGRDDGNGEPLVDEGFVYQQRPIRDLVWLVFFVLVVGLCCGIAVYAGVEKTDHASALFHKDYHTDPAYCSDLPVNETAREESTALYGITDKPETNGFLEFLEQGWPWILGAAMAAVAFGFIFVLLFSWFAALMVYSVAAVLVAVPLGAGLINIFVYEKAWGWAFVVLGVAILILLLCLNSQLQLTAKLLDLGADGLRANLDLVFFCVCLKLVLLAVITGLICFAILSLANGNFVVNDRVDISQFPDACVTPKFSLSLRSPVDCCDWNLKNWVVGYLVLIFIMVLWCIYLFDQIKVYVLAGVISQWYFADDENRGNMSIMTSLGFAMCQSFGSLVLSSLILTIVALIRTISRYLAKKANEENAKCKWFLTCMTCIVEAISHLVEWVTDFATVRMSITGESFYRAGVNVVKMMTDNLIDAYSIWWFPPIVLYTCAFLIAVSSSAVLALSARETWNDEHEFSDVRKWSWYIFLICFFLMLVVLRFFSNMLIDAVNTIFVCFAIERTKQTHKNPKAHEVFLSLPGFEAFAGGSGLAGGGDGPTTAPRPQSAT